MLEHLDINMAIKYKMNRYKIWLVILSAFLILFNTSCQQEVFTENVEKEVDRGIVFVNSNPPGAKIYLDDKYSGSVTPDTIKWLSHAEHKITLKFTLIRDTTVRLIPSISGNRSVFIDYFASSSNYGSIICNSTPSNASIFLNGINKSVNTPNTLTYLFPGEYNVKFRYHGFRDDSSMVVVYGGRTSYISKKLQDTSTWIDYRDYNSKIPSNRIMSVKTDKFNNVWIGTLENGIAKITNGKFTTYNSSNSGLPYNFTSCLEVDKNNNIWVGTIDGLAKFDGTTWTVYTKTSSILPDNYITALFADSENNVWVGTINGLVKITNNTMTLYKTSNSGIAHNSISAIVSDNQGGLWFGVAGGISYLKNGTWTYYSRESHGLAGHEVRCFAIEPNGNILASFDENLIAGIPGGLMRFDGTNWRNVQVTEIPSGRIQKIFIDKRGNKWISSASGFLVIKPDNTQTLFRSTNYYMASYDVREIAVDDNSTAWIALYGGGILKWKANNF